MLVVAQSEEAIDRSLAILRWQNRLAAILVGGFALLFAAMIFRTSQALIPYVGAVGAILGLFAARWHWRRSLKRLSSSFLKVEGEHLEVRGMAGGRLAHVRFRISDVVGFEVGRSGTLLSRSLPAVRAIDYTALIVSDIRGGSIALDFAGVIFDSEQLDKLRESLAAIHKQSDR